MCKHCNDENYEPIIEPSDKDQLQIEAGITIPYDVEEENPKLVIDLLYEWGELTSKSVSINYCPICGRRLSSNNAIAQMIKKTF